MTTILLVDDESAVRDAFRSVMDWEAHGFTIAAGAGSGVEALRLLRQQNFDVLVTDIRMPEMDGLALIEEALRVHPDLAVVVLSAYDDYSLVRKAFRLGAHDYFLKADSEPEELLDTLVGTVERVRRSRHGERMIQEQRLAERDARVTRYLNASECDGESTSDQVRENLRVIVGDRRYLIARLAFEDRSREHGHFIEHARSRLQQKQMGEVFRSGDAELVMLLIPEPVRTEDDDSILLKRVAQFLYELLGFKDHGARTLFSVGMSGVYDDVDRCREAYCEASRMLEHRFEFGPGSIVTARMLRGDSTEPVDEALEREIAAVVHEVGLARFDAVEEHLRVIRTFIADHHLSRDRALYSVYLRLYVKVQHLILARGIDLNDVLSENDRFLAQLQVADTLEEVDRRVVAWFAKLFEVLRSPTGEYAGNPVLTAQAFMRRNYHRRLKLAQIAEHVAVHPGYLSRLFSQRVGISPIAFLTSLRIEKAKEQLRSTDLRVYEIAEANGFESAEYFARVFKRRTGVTPQEFRNRE